LEYAAAAADSPERSPRPAPSPSRAAAIALEERLASERAAKAAGLPPPPPGLPPAALSSTRARRFNAAEAAADAATDAAVASPRRQSFAAREAEAMIWGDDSNGWGEGVPEGVDAVLWRSQIGPSGTPSSSSSPSSYGERGPISSDALYAARTEVGGEGAEEARARVRWAEEMSRASALLDVERRARPPTEEELLAVPWRLLSHMTPFTQQRLVPWEAYTTRRGGETARRGSAAQRRGGGGGGGGGVFLAESEGSPRTLGEATEAGGILLPPVREASPRGGGGSRSRAVSRQEQQGGVLLPPL
tara:strand:+ start:142 stop:1050 length:909 start_codon:yes stop_codon:yes gene_type:complete